MPKIRWNPNSESGKELVRTLMDGLPIIVEALDYMASSIMYRDQEKAEHIMKYSNEINKMYNDSILDDSSDGRDG